MENGNYQLEEMRRQWVGSEEVKNSLKQAFLIVNVVNAGLAGINILRRSDADMPLLSAICIMAIVGWMVFCIISTSRGQRRDKSCADKSIETYLQRPAVTHDQSSQVPMAPSWVNLEAINGSNISNEMGEDVKVNTAQELWLKSSKSANRKFNLKGAGCVALNLVNTSYATSSVVLNHLPVPPDWFLLSLSVVCLLGYIAFVNPFNDDSTTFSRIHQRSVNEKLNGGEKTMALEEDQKMIGHHVNSYKLYHRNSSTNSTVSGLESNDSMVKISQELQGQLRPHPWKPKEEKKTLFEPQLVYEDHQPPLPKKQMNGPKVQQVRARRFFNFPVKAQLAMVISSMLCLVLHHMIEDGNRSEEETVYGVVIVTVCIIVFIFCLPTIHRNIHNNWPCNFQI